VSQGLAVGLHNTEKKGLLKSIVIIPVGYFGYAVGYSRSDMISNLNMVSFSESRLNLRNLKFAKQKAIPVTGPLCLLQENRRKTGERIWV
jgi:hypothetical protein